MEAGMKDDSEKDRWDLLEMACVKDEVKVLTHGALKYSPGNWKKVPDAKDRYFAAAMRQWAPTIYIASCNHCRGTGRISTGNVK